MLRTAAFLLVALLLLPLVACEEASTGTHALTSARGRCGWFLAGVKTPELSSSPSGLMNPRMLVVVQPPIANTYAYV